MARRRPEDLRSAVECYVLPILEQGEQEGSHYLSFVAMLQQHADPRMFEAMPEHLQASTRDSGTRSATSLRRSPIRCGHTGSARRSPSVSTHLPVAQRAQAAA